MRWETRAQGVKKDRAGLAQPVAVCEMSVQHLRGAGTVCKMTMQHLHGLFTVCEMTMQHLHGLFTVCKMTVQHLHSPFTVCGGTMQHLHGLFTVCEMIMQHLHGLFTVCGGTMQHLHGLVAVCAPVPRRLTIHPCGMSGGRIQYAPTRVQSFAPTCTRQKFAGVRRRPRQNSPSIPDAALHLPHTQIFNVYEEQQTTQHNADDGARRADRSAELAAPQATR